MMILTTYQNAADFLLKAQADLEKNEAANNLMLGICLRLKNFPEQITTAPFLATVADEYGLVIAAVNLVYTPPELRRRGYASACVAALSQLLLDAGWKFCCLFTDMSNPTSNHIYQQIGYTPVCDFNEYIFEVTA